MTKITMIGAGNLATHLCRTLKDSGHEIIQVYSRTEKSAYELSNRINVPYTTDLESIISSDLAIIAVNDDCIHNIEKHIDFPKVHTSGTKPMSILNGEEIGVFYPLQTFNKNIEIKFNSIPICIEASNTELMQSLTVLAQSISSKVVKLNSDQRQRLHLAAVISCNFSNLLYQLSEEICQEEDIPFDILQPLIFETAKKIQKTSPSMAQTGPAKRGDSETIEKHIKLLESNIEKEKIYKLLTESIKKRK
ncbi:MAG: DUF2520 domain-containing protein [Flavobacteriales bacterium]|jgi:predicted short-subunit dehydrogenase-like oxidoreductase (DUF2520 family)|nr:hypothetical protein [Flavobacteriales bacterium]MDG1917576.1 DUF2520 domain-containing protein [Flavobacteriales bacterium]|tara:strand:- start:15526 stop:16272 length:747 start_codon:yes stop_codon:yes gene_type:complete